jgi:prolipoprotein diacylglyceryltransferase
MMLILYGITRFVIEFSRDDNPLEYGDLTISQVLSIVLILLGIVFMLVFEKLKPDKSG